MSSFLTFQTDESRFAIACAVGEQVTLGSAEACDIVLAGEGVAPRLGTLDRLSERRFRFTAAAREVRLIVNGVTAGDWEVDAPFHLMLGVGLVKVDVGEAPSGAGGQGTTMRRRDYLMGPGVLRQRSAMPASATTAAAAVAVVSPAKESIHAKPEPVKGTPEVAKPTKDVAKAGKSAAAASPPPPPPPKPPAAPGADLAVALAALPMISDDTPRAATAAATPVKRSGWKWAALIALAGTTAAILRDWPAGKPEPVAEAPPAAAKMTAPAPAAEVVPPKPVPVTPPPVDTKSVAAREAAVLVRHFLASWKEADAASVLSFVSVAASAYFEVPNPSSEVILRMEEEFRERWQAREIELLGEAVARGVSVTEAEVMQRYRFTVRGRSREAAGTSELRCTVRKEDAHGWRIVRAAESLKLTESKPSRASLSPATALRELKPVLNAEEMKEARAAHLNALIQSGAMKDALVEILRLGRQQPQETGWRFAADKVCDALARELFAEGKWKDASCVEEVKALSERGHVAAMLLHGHLARAGYGVPRSDGQGEVLYRKAYEASESREARFYYAEMLFTKNEAERASALALAVMSPSKHPLEAYLAAHLLWKKAELDPSLWQQVYEIVARVAEQHAPARNLAGLVLLKHGQSRKERERGFHLIEQAAEAGVVEAMKNLAACYEYGDGCAKDAAAAAQWKAKLAETPPPKRRHFSEWPVE